jgi:hypothetical protein
MSMGQNFNFIVCCLNQFLLVRSGRIMSDWELGAQVTLFIDGEISGSRSLVSTPFHQIDDGGGTRQMCMVKVQNVEPAFESTQPLGMGTGVKLSDCIGMQIPWLEIDIRGDVREADTLQRHLMKLGDATSRARYGRPPTSDSSPHIEGIV